MSDQNKPVFKARKPYNTRTLKFKAMKPLQEAAPPEIDYKLIGSRIKHARLHVGITQEYLSELVGVTPAFVGHIERGERRVSLTTFLKIASVLNVSTDYLFSAGKPSEDTEVTGAIVQMIDRRSLKTKEAVLDIVSAALKHLD